MNEAPVADLELAKKMTAVVCRAPLLAGHSVEWRQLLGGLTHITYLLHTETGDKYVVKFLSREMEELRLAIPSESVVQNTQFAGESGVGARVLFSLPDLPAIVIEFLNGKTLSASEVRQPAYITRIAQAVRRLHKHTPLMATQSDVFSFLDRYLQVVAEHTLITPDGLLESLPAVRQIQHALSRNGLDATPCNNDLVPANMIDDGRHIRLIDYDYSGMNDPMFDIGNLAMEADFDGDQLANLCEAYLGARDPIQCARAQLFGISAQYTWCLLLIAMDELLNVPASKTVSYREEATRRWLWAASQLSEASLADVIDIAARV